MQFSFITFIVLFFLNIHTTRFHKGYDHFEQVHSEYFKIFEAKKPGGGFQFEKTKKLDFVIDAMLKLANA